MAERKKSSSYSINEQFVIECNLSYAINKIGGRWKLQILGKLEHRRYRFSEFKKEFSYISERMLSSQLQALEQDGMIKRYVYAEVPPRVEYELTPLARELSPILQKLSEWGRKHKDVNWQTLDEVLKD